MTTARRITEPQARREWALWFSQLDEEVPYRKRAYEAGKLAAQIAVGVVAPNEVRLQAMEWCRGKGYLVLQDRLVEHFVYGYARSRGRENLEPMSSGYTPLLPPPAGAVDEPTMEEQTGYGTSVLERLFRDPAARLTNPYLDAVAMSCIHSMVLRVWFVFEGEPAVDRFAHQRRVEWEFPNCTLVDSVEYSELPPAGGHFTVAQQDLVGQPDWFTLFKFAEAVAGTFPRATITTFELKATNAGKAKEHDHRRLL